MVFHIQGAEIAETLRSLSKRIDTPQGFKLTILVTPGQQPQTPLTEENMLLMKEAMSRRYNIEMKALDLSSFKDDPILQQKGLYMPLTRKVILDHAVKVINENIPDLVFLSLRDNNLRNIDSLKRLAESCGTLKCLDLSKNQVMNHIIGSFASLSKPVNFFIHHRLDWKLG